MWVSFSATNFAGFCLAAAVFASICILKDAYFALNENPRFYMGLFMVVSILSAVVFARNWYAGEELVTDGTLNFRCMNGVAAVMLLVLFTVMAVRYIIGQARTGAEAVI